MDDAADQIDAGAGKADGHSRRAENDEVESKGISRHPPESTTRTGPEFDTYKDTLEDAIEGTKDALADAEEA